MLRESGTAREILSIQKELEHQRSTWTEHWQDVAQFVLQRQDDFYGTRKPGEKRTERVYDSVAPMAAEKCATLIESVATPRDMRWHGLQPMDKELRGDRSIQQTFEEATDLLFMRRYSGGGNFATQWAETLLSMVCFGTGVMLVEDAPGRGLSYKSTHLGEHYLMENPWGEIDTDYRKFRMRGHQAIRFYNDAPSELLQKWEKGKNEWFWFVHCVKPNPDYVPGAFGDRQKYLSQHVSEDHAVLLRTGGYRTFPYVIVRYVTAPNEVYGRGPAMIALPEIKMLNRMRRSDLRARNLAVAPPILTANESSVRRVNLKENAINFGALDANGNQLIVPWQSGARIDLSNDSIQQSHQIINDGFLIRLFQILVETPQMTATEVMERRQDKASLLAPTMGRIQSEGLSRLIERELDILAVRGELPEHPRLENFAYEVEYTSPISRMLKAENALSVQRTVDAVVPIAQIDPSVLDAFNWDEYAKIIAEANNAPARLFFSEEEMEAKRKAQQEQQMMQMASQMAPEFAGAAKDLAQAQSYGR